MVLTCEVATDFCMKAVYYFHHMRCCFCCRHCWCSVCSHPFLTMYLIPNTSSQIITASPIDFIYWGWSPFIWTALCSSTWVFCVPLYLLTEVAGSTLKPPSNSSSHTYLFPPPSMRCSVTKGYGLLFQTPHWWRWEKAKFSGSNTGRTAGGAAANTAATLRCTGSTDVCSNGIACCWIDSALR